MSAKRMLIVLLSLGLLAGCGSDPASNASSSGKSFEEAIGMDQASLNAREVKVQEAIRTCMKAEGFEYVPVDPSQNGMSMKFDEDDSISMKERRTKGYGISTGFMMKARPASRQDDPNAKIRDALSEADQDAYDVAMMGAETAAQMKAAKGASGASGVGGIRISRQAGENGSPTDQGCMGKAQSEVPGGPEQLGDDLKEMQERAQADPRLIAKLKDWASCMADGGYTDFENPGDARDSIRDRMDEIMGATDQGDGVTSFAIGGDDIDQAKLADLKQEEIRVAVLDGTCQKKTGLDQTIKEVRKDAEQRFLDEHPNLTSGS